MGGRRWRLGLPAKWKCASERCPSSERNDQGGKRRGSQRSLFRIVYARGAIPNEAGPTRCRATPALPREEESFFTNGFHD